MPQTIRLATVDSTNGYAKALAQNGALNGTVVFADTQTCGRGRLGRHFVSPSGGVYMSVILRPEISFDELISLTAMTAVETKCAIETVCGISTSIKWVNDLIYHGRKVCGILVENGFDGDKISYIVVGIGINLASNALGIDGAGCLGCDISLREPLVNEIAHRLISRIGDLHSGYYLPEYKKCSCVLGREITVYKDGSKRTAIAKSITDKGFLVVEYTNGEAETLSGFEVSVRGIGVGY